MCIRDSLSFLFLPSCQIPPKNFDYSIRCCSFVVAYPHLPPDRITFFEFLQARQHDPPLASGMPGPIQGVKRLLAVVFSCLPSGVAAPRWAILVWVSQVCRSYG